VKAMTNIRIRRSK